MPVKISNALIDLRSCFKVNSCRYTNTGNASGNHGNRVISSTTRRFVHREAYSAVIFQHAMLLSPISWIDKQHSHMMESKDGVIRVCSRTYATAARTDEPGTSRVQGLLATIPSPEKIPPEEVELVDKDEAKFLFTERAAEKLSNISTLENDPNVSLRVAVESGGCHGYQYKLELTSENAVDDYRFVHPNYRNAAVVVDAISLGLLKGSTLDYATELIGSSFRIVDNPQAKSAGCGCGISWEAKF